MLFDKVCNYIEMYVEKDRELHKILSLLRQARLFEFDKPAQELGQYHVPDEDLKNFYMPFPVVAVEDPAGMVILKDTIDDQIGTTTPRLFCEVTCLGVDPTMYGDSPPNADIMAKLMEERYGDLSKVIILTTGRINSLVNHPRPDNPHGFGADVEVGWQAMFTEDDYQRFYLPDNEAAEPFAKNAIVAMEELIYLQNPEFFILEKSPIKMKIKKGKIPRSHQRPKYTVLRPKEIRRKMKLSESGSGSKKNPHERRRHTRYLRDEIYKFENGVELEMKLDPVGMPYYKKTIIPATWIGPSENLVKNHRYKVRLDL